MSKVAHLIGNGDNASMYKPAKGIKITCNLPPFTVRNTYATTIVDFKMCKAITEGSVVIPGDWIMGYRPSIWYDKNEGNFKMRFGSQIREFYKVLPEYAKNYTNLNCGHFAAHYIANKIKATEIHLYGFDSLFDMNLRSSTDFVLNSDRGATNNVRLNDNWRPIWQGIFNEFSDTQFVLYHKHNNIKFSVPKNVEIRTKS
ncbi:MAG TPA: hypothetical protein DCW83_13440 [Saprospirales bacterium]|jgi:hypothetical protein|nr:hypothetical protein [Saprospirales bacterium]